jgi:CRISPR-associated protein Cas5h
MKIVCFRLTGRYGHFLRAEGGVSALSYPIPPRTAVLGLLGAILGLEKDQPQAVLEPAYIAIQGRIPQTHWHGTKFRQDPVEHLPRTIEKNMKAKAGGNIDLPKIAAQEWLLNPDYQMWVSLPDPFQSELEQRLKERRWHFQPCLGLSEMLAELVYLHSASARPVPAGIHAVSSLVPQDEVEPDWEKVFAQELVIHSLRLPRAVTPDRVFSHASYFMERDARPLPVKTARAFEAAQQVFMFL